MRISFILDEFLPESSGGAINVAFNLACGLVKAGHDLLVLSSTADFEKVGDCEFHGIKIKKVFAQPLGRFRNWRNLNNKSLLKESEKVLAEFKPDVVHIHSLHHRFSYGVIALVEKHSKAVFLTCHDPQIVYNGKIFPKRKICNLDPKYDYKISWRDKLKKDGLNYNPFQRFLIKRKLKNLDKIFAVSQALRDALEANGISNIEVMHNGIDVNEWQDSEAPEGNRILFAGRVDEAKGAGVLVRCFEQIKKEVPDAKLIIIGDKDFKAGSGGDIEVLPWLDREEIKKEFEKARVVVVPSLYLDPFPTVNLEAMACSRSVIGTCFGGTREIVVDNETGYLANPYNEKALTDKIIDLLKNPEKAIAFGKAGRKRIEKFFSLEKQVQETLSWYNRFL